MNEFDLISRLAAQLKSPLQPGVVGIGDDAAAIPQKDGFLLLTCDIAVEGRHFRRGVNPLADVGWKAAAASVSDIAACGGTPDFALISLGVPEAVPVEEYEELYRGISEAAEKFGFQVVGGNVSGSEQLLVDCFMVGSAKRFVSRAGARPGDTVALCGTTGDSEAGRRLLEQSARSEGEEILVRRHLRPDVGLELVEFLQEHATAAIDVSDSLAAELHHLSERSGVRIEVDGASVPVSPELRAFAAARGERPDEFTLYGGEDYRLLFTVPADRLAGLDRVEVVAIGKVSEGSGVFFSGTPLANRGWDHLRKSQ